MSVFGAVLGGLLMPFRGRDMNKRFPTTHADASISLMDWSRQQQRVDWQRMAQQYIQQLSPDEMKRIDEARKKRAEYEALSPTQRLFVDEPPKV